MRREKMIALCKERTIRSLPLHSRIHKMRHEDLWVKRDDELGFGVSGSKLRKYVSILPILKKQNKKVALIGSMYSNHVLSFLQMLKQEGISYQLFLQRPNMIEKEGNAFFLSLLLQDDEVIWVEKVPEVLEPSWKQHWEGVVGEELFWIPIGGCMEEALVGSLTLALDLVQNEEENNVVFDHVFVDAGTGLLAIGLILGLAYLQRNVEVHVVLMAGKEVEFLEKLKRFHAYLEGELGESISLESVSHRCLLPETARSFGSHNASVFQMIKKTAEKEGFFLDPLYTAKLLITVRETQKKEEIKGEIVWIHSGGALSLSGFQKAKFV